MKIKDKMTLNQIHYTRTFIKLKMAALLLCLFFAATVVVGAEGYPFTKEEVVYLDDTIRAIVDDMLAPQALVYDARITKLEASHQQQNRKIRMLEIREKRQRKTIQNLTSMVIELMDSANFRHNKRTLPSKIRQKDKGKAPLEPNTIKLRNSKSSVRDLKTEGGRKTRGSSGQNFRARAASAQVAFTAYLDNFIEHVAEYRMIKYNRVHLNDGNGYNTFTGVFTVPVSGVYLFTYHWDSHSRKTILALMVDNVQHGAAVTLSVSNNDAMGGQTVIVRVNAGQAVWIEEKYENDGEILAYTWAQYATFAGTLLY